MMGIPQPRLSRESVIATALALIEREGFDRFSMRALARELGVQPGAVYWHIADREVLLAEVSAHVLAEVVVPDPGLPWDSWVSEFARSYRRVLHRHPRTAPLINFNLSSNSATIFPAVEAVLAQLHDAGFAGQGLVDAYNVVVGTLIGFVGAELARLPADADPAWVDARRSELAELDPMAYPLLAQHRALMANRAFVTRWLPGEEAPLDAGFEAMLGVVVDGLRRRLDG